MKYFNIILGIAVLLILNSCVKHYRWVSVGDSITFQNGKKFHHESLKNIKAIGYQDLIISQADTPISLVNKGMSGFSMSGRDSSIYLSLKDYDFSADDLITIFVGTNDFKKDKPIFSADTLNSFSYCLKSLISNIKRQNQFGEIYLITPLKRDKDGYDTKSKNKSGHSLSEYRDEIVNIGSEFDIPVIDLYYNSGIDENNLSKYTYDGLHPNNQGYKIIADAILKTLKIE